MLKPSIYEKSTPVKNQRNLIYNKNKGKISVDFVNSMNLTNQNFSNNKPYKLGNVSTSIKQKKIPNYSVIATQRNIKSGLPTGNTNLNSSKIETRNESPFNNNLLKNTKEKFFKEEILSTNKLNISGNNFSTRKINNSINKKIDSFSRPPADHSNNNSISNCNFKGLNLNNQNLFNVNKASSKTNQVNLAATQFSFPKNIEALKNQDTGIFAKVPQQPQHCSNILLKENFDNSQMPITPIVPIKNSLNLKGNISSNNNSNNNNSSFIKLSKPVKPNSMNLNYDIKTTNPINKVIPIRSKLTKSNNNSIRNSSTNDRLDQSNVIEQLNTSKNNNTNTSISININNFNQKNYHHGGHSSSLIVKKMCEIDNVDCPEQQHFFNVALQRHNRMLAKHFENVYDDLSDDKLTLS
jgi:hypothetical protein